MMFRMIVHLPALKVGDIQRGQTLQTNLTLGDPTPALLIPNGAFYNETGGSWVSW
jgi:HlyD family secretion protein